MKTRFFTVAILSIILLVLITACSTQPTATSPQNVINPPVVTETVSPTTAPASSTVLDGKTLLETRCISCHGLGQIINRTGSQDQWTSLVENMVQRGAVLTTEEQKVLIQYLAATFK